MKKLKNNIAFISVNYNSASKYFDFLKSLSSISMHQITLKVVIVDNASSISDLKLLKKFVKLFSEKINIELIESKFNRGYSSGLNLGLDGLVSNEYDYIVMSNNDLRYSFDFVKNLYSKRFPDDVFVVFPDVITDGRQHENPRFIKKINKRRQFLYWLYYQNYNIARLIDFTLNILNLGNRNKIRTKLLNTTEIYLGVGACFILTINYLNRFDLLDDSVFLWGEECLLSHQVRSVGGVQIYEPSLVVHHDAHSSVSSIVGRKKFDLMKESYNVYKHKF